MRADVVYVVSIDSILKRTAILVNLQYVFLSLVHVHNLHPGANSHTGYKFAPEVYFGHVNGVLRICTGCKFAPFFELVQILFASGCKLCT